MWRIWIKLIKESQGKRVCELNRKQLCRDYEVYLGIENVGHSETIFDQYLWEYDNDICPGSGEITYRDGDVGCSEHYRNVEGNEGDVPHI